MKFCDSEELRLSLQHIFPTLEIEDLVPTHSNQRIVYFCRFRFPEENQYSDEEYTLFSRWATWGDVVLKVSQSVSAKSIARLEKEIEILNEINSVYYPTLYYYDVFSEDPETEEKFDKSLFITIEERINGRSLNDARAEFVSEAAVAELLYELTEGLKILWNHKQKIVHRDLKPDNIIIRPNNKPVIIDLGIIREEGSVGLTATRFMPGPCSPAYASPEQARNDKQNINFRSDFFSLGVIVYELIIGSNPFVFADDDDVDDVLDHVQNHQPVNLFTSDASSERFSNFIERMMEKEPYQRFRTVEAMQTELKEIIEGQV